MYAAPAGSSLSCKAASLKLEHKKELGSSLTLLNFACLWLPPVRTVHSRLSIYWGAVVYQTVLGSGDTR